MDERTHLETFLRGMETTNVHDGLSFPDCLETFLRGMETGPSPFSPFFCLPLETFLRGMETGQGVNADGKQRSALKPSLEGWKQIIRIPHFMVSEP